MSTMPPKRSAPKKTYEPRRTDGARTDDAGESTREPVGDSHLASEMGDLIAAAIAKAVPAALAQMFPAAHLWDGNQIGLGYPTLAKMRYPPSRPKTMNWYRSRSSSTSAILWGAQSAFQPQGTDCEAQPTKIPSEWLLQLVFQHGVLYLYMTVWLLITTRPGGLCNCAGW